MKTIPFVTAAFIGSMQSIHAQANDSFANAISIANNSSVTGNATTATTEPGERTTAVSGVTLQRTLWYRYVAPARGVVRINSPRPVPFAQAIQVFRGNSLTALNLVAADSAGSGFGPVDVEFPAEAGMEFRIVFSQRSTGSGNPDFSFTVQQEAWPYGSTTTPLTLPDVPTTARPVNDNIEQAQVIQSSPNPVAVLGYNYDATQNNLGPEPGVTGHQTLWYSWTAPQRGIAVLTTPSSPVLSFNPVLAVFRGNGLTALNLVAQGRGIRGFNRPITISFPVEAGMEYKISMAGDAIAQSGPFVFNLRTDPWPYGGFPVVAPGVPTASVPLNDQFEGATTIPSALGKYTIFDYNQSATTASSGFEPSVVGFKSLWYKWTAPENATVILQTPTAPAIGFGHALTTHTGPSFDRLAQLPVGAGSIRVTTSTGAGSTQFSAVKGTTYYFSISATSNSAEGSVAFSLEALKDIEKPAITSVKKVPKKTFSKSIVISGTASDNIGVASVQYRVGKAKPKTATGTTSWSLTAKLKKGANTITIIATDAAGNATTRSIKIRRS
ncbi:MAG: hypothetical protein HC845_13435 [Akkermansiaceae bacterium]|nr:hypothetical protein [Akkermansiaceae bacterium]